MGLLLGRALPPPSFGPNPKGQQFFSVNLPSLFLMHRKDILIVFLGSPKPKWSVNIDKKSLHFLHSHRQSAKTVLGRSLCSKLATWVCVGWCVPDSRVHWFVSMRFAPFYEMLSLGSTVVIQHMCCHNIMIWVGGNMCEILRKTSFSDPKNSTVYWRKSIMKLQLIYLIQFLFWWKKYDLRWRY